MKARLLIPVAFAAVGMLGGCAEHPQQPPLYTSPALEKVDTGLEKAPFAVGDVFVFDNPPERWEVIKIDDDFVYWHDGGASYEQTAWSTLLPKLRWGGGGTGNDAGVRQIEMVEGQLHSLKEGQVFSFSEKTIHSRPPKISQALWRCAVLKKEQIVVKAGKADTWQVLCEIDGKERIVMNYSEDIGHFVRAIFSLDDGQIFVRQLTGFARANPVQASK